MGREAQMLELLDTTTELVCSTGPDGRMNYVNAAWCHVMGYTANEAIGQSPIAFVAPEDRARASGVIQRLIRGEAIAEFEAQGLKKDGSRVVLGDDDRRGLRCHTSGVSRCHGGAGAHQEMRARLVGTLAAPVSLDDLLHTADTALYVAKRARNSLTLTSSTTSSAA